MLSIKFYNLKRILFLILWSFLPWLYLNFGTSSFSTYFTLPISFRYIMFVYSPLFLLTGAVISKIITNKQKLVVASLLLAGITVLSGVICGYLIKGTGYFTDHTTALKLIVDKAEKFSLTQCVILSDEEDNWRWQKTIEILSNSIRIKGINEIDNDQFLIIKRGNLDLPEAHINSSIKVMMFSFGINEQ